MGTWSISLPAPAKQPARRSGTLGPFWIGLDSERTSEQKSTENQYVSPEPVAPSQAGRHPQQPEEVGQANEQGRPRTNQLNGAFGVLAGLYAVPNTTAVHTFLVHRRTLRELLFDAYPRIKKIFGERVNAELRLIEDMEDNLERLRVSIVTNRGDARQALERFDEEWWLDHVQFSEGLLNFTLRRE
jgi:hypothetical protein